MEVMLRCSLLMRMVLDLAAEVVQQAGTKAAFKSHPLSVMMSDIQVLSTHYLCKVDVCAANLALQPH